MLQYYFVYWCHFANLIYVSIETIVKIFHARYSSWKHCIDFNK